MDQSLLNKIEQHVKKRTGGISPVHGFGHLKRTAIGAKWFARVFGESEDSQNIAYLAGLIHDLERPNTELIDHTDLSVNEAKKLMDDFDVEQATQDKVLNFISEHREFGDLELSAQWVFLSDKLLEQSGAYVIFRRFYYVGECDDFQTTDFYEAIMTHSTKRMKKFDPQNFDQKVRRLAEYQFDILKKFMKSFEEKQAWALRLGKVFYDYGKQSSPGLENLIRDYVSETDDEKLLQNEAMAYLDGKKYDEFEKLLDF